MELQNFKGQNNDQRMSSREIAELTGKNHQHVLRDIENLNVSYQKLGMSKVGQTTYKDSWNREQREFLLTKIQTMDLMTGYSVELRIKVNRRWEELENRNPIQMLTKYDVARLLLESEEEKKQLQLEIKENEPLVNFAKALHISEHNILIGDLAKILKQNGVDIGRDRLFEWLRDNKYLMVQGENWNSPSQKSLELKLFEVKTRTINNPDGSVRVTKTTKVTPKGQEYFINKFLKAA